MGWGTPDVYNQPEQFGLTIEAEAHEPGLSYEFNLALVLTDGDRYWFVQDSGCSCPSPFEDYTSLESLGDSIPRHEAYDLLAEFIDAHDGREGAEW